MTQEPTPIFLFTPYFAARTPERQRELDLCLTQNLACEDLAHVYLLVDDGHRPPVQHAHLTVLDIARRPTYADWLRLTREHGLRGISLLANSDIHFDASLPVVRQTLARPRAFLALSRYELTRGELVAHPRPEWSQDVWGLHTDSDWPDSLAKALDVPLGVPRCDNKIAYLFAIHGWTLHNPQPLLRSVHVHESQQRHYDKTADLTVLGAVAYVHATPAADTASRVDIDVWALNTEAVGAVTINRSLDKWAIERTQRALETVQTEGPAQSAAKTEAPPPAAAPAGPPPGMELPMLEAEVQIPPPPVRSDWPRFASQGTLRWSAGTRFELRVLGDDCLVVDWLCPDKSFTVPAATVPELPDTPTLLKLFVPAVLPTDPITVANRPRDKKDLHFWQYPAATERQARDNHAGIPAGGNVDAETRTVHTYLGLPWATYIDKKSIPGAELRPIATRIAGLHALVRSLGWRLRVHTVCQQIHWRRTIDTFGSCGVTDLHLSHATDDLDPRREGWPFVIHSWPLIAPNIEEPSRRVGLTIGKPVGERKYLASFIGAYMPHYRSDARVQLAEAAKASGRSDLLVELTDLWHFNKVVYNEQVAGKALADAEREAQEASTRRYNEVLSDSVFSLCPEGAGPNTLRIWESLAVGAIPVIVAGGWVLPTATPGQPDLMNCCVIANLSDTRDFLSRLVTITGGQRETMQAAGMAAYAQLRHRRCFGAFASA